MKSSVTWKIKVALITIILFLIIATVVTTTTVILLLRPKSTSSGTTRQFYNGSFRILNLNYTNDYQKSSSDQFTSLATQIQTLMAFTFGHSELRNQYKTSEVISLKPGSVIVQFVLLFNTTNEETTKLLTIDSVYQIFLGNFGNSSWSGFHIDTSSFNISAISISDAENLLHSGLISSTSSSNIQTTTVSPNSASVSSTINTLQDFTGCGIGGPSVTNRIVGGTTAALGSWPWQASLHYNGYHLCGASLISNTWLVSAAHCFTKYKDVTLWTVILGTITLSNGKGLEVKEIIINENYITSDYVYDIALLRLMTPIQFTKQIRPVCLPEKSTFFPDNTTCYITGWGSTVSGGSPSVTLQQAHVKIINYDLCSSTAMYGSLIRPSMICAGYVEGGIDSCQGDSGGPLVTTRFNGTWYLVGSVSYGTGCALPNKPGVYSRTTYLRSWITEKTGL